MRESAEPFGTDHTGDIVSFTAVGTGEPGTTPRPWVCYTQPSGIIPLNVDWYTPDGAVVPYTNVPATDGISQYINGGSDPGNVLLRGINYYSPDGDYCCVLAKSCTAPERRCVTFSEC